MSLFLLALYVFLQSAPVYKWFTIDPKFTAFVGLVFVVVLLVESFLVYSNRHPLWHRTAA
jgi:hypothetical protein